MNWYLIVIFILVIAVIGILLLITFGRRGTNNVPKRPELPDVDIKKPEPMDTKPMDEYERDKVRSHTENLVDDINKRYQ